MTDTIKRVHCILEWHTIFNRPITLMSYESICIHLVTCSPMRHTQECRYMQLYSDQQSIFRSNVYYVSHNNSNANNLKQMLSDSQTGLTSLLFDFVEKLSKLSRSILYCLSEHIIQFLQLRKLALVSQINNVKLYNHNMSFFVVTDAATIRTVGSQTYSRRASVQQEDGPDIVKHRN